MSSPESTGKFKREMEGQFPGLPINQAIIPQAPADFTKVNRRKRCGNCDACKIKENCNTCKNCINRKILKQTCILRRCHFLHHKPASSNSATDGSSRRKRSENKNCVRKKSPESPEKLLKTVPIVSLPEQPEDVKIEEPEEPHISSSDEIEQAVNSLLEDSCKYAEIEEEVNVPEKIIVSHRPLIPKMVKRSDSTSSGSYSRNYNAKSFPESSEVLKSSSLLNKQSEISFQGSRVSFKINPSTTTQCSDPLLITNGAGVSPAIPLPAVQPHPTYQIPGNPIQGPIMIMNPSTLQKSYNSEIPRHNIVFARLPTNTGTTFPPRNGPLSSEDVFNQSTKVMENHTQFPNSSPVVVPSLSSGQFGGDFSTPKVHRRKRCGQCMPCQIKENCMKCKNCLNRKVLKQTCIHRKCLFLREKSRKDTGFCSSPIVDPQPIQQSPILSQSQQFMGHLYDTNVVSSQQQTQMPPAVFIAENYDQFRPILPANQKPHGSDISISGPVNIIPQGHVFQHGQHIQLFQNPYSGTPFQGAIPMIATPQGNYAFQMRHQHQLGGYVQGQMINPNDQMPRYYMHPTGPPIAHVKQTPEFGVINRFPQGNIRPIAIPQIPIKVEITQVREPGDKSSIDCKDVDPSHRSST